MRDVSIDQIVRSCDSMFLQEDSTHGITCAILKGQNMYAGYGKNALRSAINAYTVMELEENDTREYAQT